MDQEVKYIHIKDLVLWTENPRDPIDQNSKDQDIVNRALENRTGKWSLRKLAKEMGDHYDLSELPTVVFHGKKSVVYDGNRRIILGKIRHGLVSIPDNLNIPIPTFPEEIPCNVCSENIALHNIFRKHSKSGSWQPLERDIFLHKFMKEPKSPFLILEEETGIITASPHLNQDYVKKEVFKKTMLDKMGFSIEDERLYCKHNEKEANSILSDIARKIENKVLTTRGENRGKVIEVLEPSSQELIDRNKKNDLHLSHFKNRDKPQDFKQDISDPKSEKKNKRRSRRTSTQKSELFGGPLYLCIGEVSNLYRDIVDLYKFYTNNKIKLSKTFPNLIRMSLRLLCETASKDKEMQLNKYISIHFSKAKKTLSQNQKTTLSSHNITDSSIMQLLHAGAHTYDSSSNIEQTVALSIMIGAILTQTHRKSE